MKMKKLLFAGTIFLIASCSMNSPEALNKEIIRNKTKVNDLNRKISELETKLDSISGPEDKIQGTSVVVKKMAPEHFSHYIFISGKVEATEEAWVSPEINGQIKKIHVSEGQRVAKGQLLLNLSTDMTEKTITEVKTSLELQKKLFEKQKELWDQNIGTEVQYLQAKTAYESTEARLATLQEQMDMAMVRAPFNGIIEKIIAKEGELAMPGARLIHLVNLSDLKVKANISENYLNSVHIGEPVEVEFPDTKDSKMDLKINRIGSVIDNLSRTFEVELKMRNTGERIKPNQLATMRIEDYSSNEAFVVPTILLKQDTKGYYIYRVVERNGMKIASKIYVVPGRSSNDMTMVEKGIEPGMEIIIAGFNLVKDGTQVRIMAE